MVLAESELTKLVSDRIRKTVNKFREYPHLFFTETDIHSYFYHCLYNQKLEIKTKDDIVTTCIHKEYPTNFRYSKKTMEDYGLKRLGRRGNYDFTILNPQFIMEFDIKNVINKDIRDLEKRSENKEKFRREIVAVIEMKYVINNSKQFIEEFKKDVMKLKIGLKYQDFKAYALVFCNHKYFYIHELKEAISTTDSRIKNLLVKSYYENSKKITPKPITNGWIIS